MTVSAGVAAIRGTYVGEVALHDPQRPGSFTMKASGAGVPGTVDARVVVRLSPGAGGGTDLAYDADASVGGAIGGVGQRMLSGVTRKLAGQFFSAVDAELTGVPTAAVVVNPAEVRVDAGLASQGPSPDGRTFSRRTAGTRGSGHSGGFSLDGSAGFAVGVIAGGAVALIGVALGARLGRRR